VRAPNVIELFTGQTTGLPTLTSNGGVFDPCSSTATTTPIASEAACANTGVTAAQFAAGLPDVVAGQAGGTFGGNPLLEPESSDTFTVGAVFTPGFIEGLTASVDYYNISVDDAIQAGIGAQTILDNCLATGEATFCDLIVRDGAGSLIGGQLGEGFLLTNVNIGALERTGVDFQLDYDFETESFGGFGLTYASTIEINNNSTPFPGGEVIECSGLFVGACGQPAPTYQHRAIGSWNTPVEGLQTDITWRFNSGVDNQADDPDEIEESLSSTNYFDFSSRYEFREGVTIRAGVNNIFDRSIPVSISSGPGNFGNGNTFPGLFDTGRFLFAGVNIKL